MCVRERQTDRQGDAQMNIHEISFFRFIKK